MKYLIIPASRVPEIIFAQVKETGPAYLRYNYDNSKTFIKWEGETPDSVTDILSAPNKIFWGPYESDEFMEILKNDEWITNSPPDD